VIQEGGESAETLDRPGMQRVKAMVERRQVQAVIVAKLDRLRRSGLATNRQDGPQDARN
jgi:DNA invertase Pin-like site-specific DNA recombinase